MILDSISYSLHTSELYITTCLRKPAQVTQYQKVNYHQIARHCFVLHHSQGGPCMKDQAVAQNELTPCPHCSVHNETSSSIKKTYNNSWRCFIFHSSKKFKGLNCFLCHFYDQELISCHYSSFFLFFFVLFLLGNLGQLLQKIA